jgi:hypothetical protein
MKPKKDIAMAYLGNNPLLHMGMIEALRRGKSELIYADTDGVLLLETESKEYMLSVSAPETAARIIAGLDHAEFVVHQQFCIPTLNDKFAYRNMYDCVQAVYTGKNSLPVSGKFNISALDGCF